MCEDNRSGGCSTPIGCENVKIQDTFWDQKMKLIYEKVLPYQWDALNDRIADAEPSHCIANFKTAAAITAGTLSPGDKDHPFKGFVFQDSDLAKWLEAAAFSLTWHQDGELEKRMDDAIDLICSAQQEDGYLNTYYIINGLEKRFTNLTDNHELYCLGHMLEAACAYYHARGKRKLLDAMIRYVDLVDSIFGPEEGKKKGYPGHEVIEMALVKLYEITGEEKHRKLAAYFIDQRGVQPLYFAEEAKSNRNEFFWKDSAFQYAYYQAHKPVREQEAAVGHAVRAVYLYSGMADVARLTGDESLVQACGRIWEDIACRQMYITGAVGSSGYGEAFTFDYDLPNDSVYGETCASIGLVFFAMRMLRMKPSAMYADVMERALYNGVISGISLDGTRFFYVNPLEVLPEAIEKDEGLRHVKGERQKWFGCACCPPNTARMLSSLGSYIYTSNENTVWQHLYIGNETKLQMPCGTVTLRSKTSYPWDEKVTIDVEAPGEAALPYAFRIPGWCREYRVMLNGSPAQAEVSDGYAYLAEPLKDKDCLELFFAMPVEFVASNPKVRQNVGKAAVMRGPVVYCLEEEDNGKGLAAVHLGAHEDVRARFDRELLGGVMTVEMTGLVETAKEALYFTQEEVAFEKKHLKFIPYYAWANRTPGEMMVWINR